MSNVNFSVKAAGTNAAHRLSSVPTSGMGWSALENKQREGKGSQHYLTKTMHPNIFPFTHTKRNIGTLRKTKHPSHQLQPVP